MGGRVWEEEAFELRNSLGDEVLAIAAGLAANPEVTGRMTARQLAHEALIIVLACHDETDSELDKEGEA